jgi:hypothetical protein
MFRRRREHGAEASTACLQPATSLYGMPQVVKCDEDEPLRCLVRDENALDVAAATKRLFENVGRHGCRDIADLRRVKKRTAQR